MALVGALGLLLGACSAGPPRSASPPAAQHAVGIHVETVVDASRPTPANGPAAAHPGRRLVVTVFYPSTGPPGHQPVTDATPDRGHAPYPLIVFAHGFGSSPAAYAAVLEAWASAGYVVAAPAFPLTAATAPGGPDLADYVDQPADMSFVVTEILAESAASTGLLAGMVDPAAVGAAGHSLGGVTTLGLVADTCCTDARIRAAVVMSGDPITFPHGTTRPPTIPVLFVHGDADPVVPYVSSVEAFNGARAPKALLTVEGGGHGSPVEARGQAFGSVVRTTSDFFDRYLKGEQSAQQRLQGDGQPGTTRLALALRPGTRLRLPVPKTLSGKLSATVRPSTGLVDGQRLVVSWKGYRPGATVNVLECSTPLTGAQDCALTTATVGVPDPIGTGSISFAVHTGAVGVGTCDASHPHCVIVVNQGGSSSPDASVLTPVSFAP